MSFATINCTVGAIGFTLVAVFLGAVRGEWALATAFLVMAALLGGAAWGVHALRRRVRERDAA